MYISIFGLAIAEAISKINRNYLKDPKGTLILIIGFSLSLTILIFGLIYVEQMKKKSAQINNIGIETRVKNLDEIQASLTELVKYIESQKQSIINENIVLKNLKSEKRELEPIINANREVVNQIFKQQEKRSKWEFWLSIGLGFLLGIFASFFGSILFSSYRRFNLSKASA